MLVVFDWRVEEKEDEMKYAQKKIANIGIPLQYAIDKNTQNLDTE